MVRSNPDVGLSERQRTSLQAVFDTQSRFPQLPHEIDSTLCAHRDRFLAHILPGFSGIVARGFTMILGEYTAAMMHKCKGASLWLYPHPNVMRPHGQLDEPIKIVHKNVRDLLCGLQIIPSDESAFTCLVLGTIWQDSFCQRAKSILLDESQGISADAKTIATSFRGSSDPEIGRAHV